MKNSSSRQANKNDWERLTTDGIFLVIVVLTILFAIFAGCTDASSFDGAIEVFQSKLKRPFSVLTVGMSIAAFYVLIYRSYQASTQIHLAQTQFNSLLQQNSFKNFIDHRSEFDKNLNSVKENLNHTMIAWRSNDSIYRQVFHLNSFKYVSLSATTLDESPHSNLAQTVIYWNNFVIEWNKFERNDSLRDAIEFKNAFYLLYCDASRYYKKLTISFMKCLLPPVDQKKANIIYASLMLHRGLIVSLCEFSSVPVKDIGVVATRHGDYKKVLNPIVADIQRQRIRLIHV